MPNLFEKEGASSWVPRADPLNAPPGALLRADNLTLDDLGDISLRAGSTRVQTQLSNPVSSVHNVITAYLQGTARRIAASGDTMFVDGVNTADFSPGSAARGTDKIVFGRSQRWAFAARSNTRKVFDGTTVYDWFIPKPSIAPVLVPIAASSSIISECKSNESPAFVVNEGTLTFDQGSDVVTISSSNADDNITTATAHGLTAGDVVVIAGHSGSTPDINGSRTVSSVTDATRFKIGIDITVGGTGGTFTKQAVRLVPNATSGRGSATRTFGSDQNYGDLGGVEESSEDMVDFLVYSAAPDKVKLIQIIFGLGTGADPFKDDYYYFDFDVAGYSGSKPAANPAVESRNVDVGHDTVPSPAEVNDLLMSGDAQAAVDRAHKFGRPDRLPLVSLPRLSASASPAWAHLSAMRGSFKRIGQTTGRNWRTVRAVRVAVHMAAGSTEEFRFDNINWFAAGYRAFTGTYRVRYQEVFSAADGRIEVQSPPSEASAPVEVYQQGLRVTLSAQALANKSPLTNQYWIYLNGGQLDDWYRMTILGVSPNNSTMRLDEYSSGGGDGSNLEDSAERSRFLSHDFGIPGVLSGDMNADVLSSEVDAIITNIKLIRGLVEVPIDIIAIAGPFEYRMAVLTADGYLYFSKRNAHGTFSVYQSRNIGPDPQWLAQTPYGLFVGTKRDVTLVTGNGDENPDGTVAFDARPLHLPHPPVDNGVWVEGNDVIYRSADGIMVLSGTQVSFFPFDDIEPLFRGEGRHGVEALNTATGKFRFVVDNRSMFMLAPEGASTDTSNVLYRYSYVNRRWHRYVYPYTISALHRDVTGGVLAGTTGGEIYRLDDGIQDNGQDIPVEFWTRFDDGGNPITFKDAYDVQLGMETGALPMTVTIVKEDQTTNTTFTASTSGLEVWREDITLFGEFRLAQIRISGSTYKFALRQRNLSFRERPQLVMAVDTGYVKASRSGDLVHIYEVELDMEPFANIKIVPFFDGVAGTEVTVPTTPGLHSVYKVKLPRGSFGKRARFLIQSQSPGNAIDAGFEMYGVRMWVSPTGNQKALQPVQVFPLRGADTVSGQEQTGA